MLPRHHFIHMKFYYVLFIPIRTKVLYFFRMLEIKQYQQFTYNDVFFHAKAV